MRASAARLKMVLNNVIVDIRVSSRSFVESCQFKFRLVSVSGLASAAFDFSSTYFRVSKGRSLEPGAQSLLLLGARTKMMFLANWIPRVQLWSP